MNGARNRVARTSRRQLETLVIIGRRLVVFTPKRARAKVIAFDTTVFDVAENIRRWFLQPPGDCIENRSVRTRATTIRNSIAEMTKTNRSIPASI